jgi:hypothetical protein
MLVERGYTIMEKELSETTKQVQTLSTATDVLNTAEEIKEYNSLIEKSEMTTPETCRASLDGN